MNNPETLKLIDEVCNLLDKEKIEEAISLVRKALKMDSSNPGLLVCLFWALHDACERFLLLTDKSKVWEYLRQMADILPQIADVSWVGERSNLRKRGDEYTAYFNLLYKLRPQENDLLSVLHAKESKNGSLYENVCEWISYHRDCMNADERGDAGALLYVYLRDERSQLSLNQVDDALWLYLSLDCQTPSLLHSQILRFASVYTVDNPTFDFVRFLKAWGIQNFRPEDFTESEYHPSLLSAVCKAWVVCAVLGKQTTVRAKDLLDELSWFEGVEDEVCNRLREPFYWYIFNLWNRGFKSKSLEAFDTYLLFMEGCQASIWHSRIIELALDCMQGDASLRFLTFMKRCGESTFYADDWVGVPQTHLSPLAWTVARRCFYIIQTTDHHDLQTIDWLISIYDNLLYRGFQSMDLLTELAMMHRWVGHYECTQYICCRLLLLQSQNAVLIRLLADVSADEHQKQLCLHRLSMVEHGALTVSDNTLTDFYAMLEGLKLHMDTLIAAKDAVPNSSKLNYFRTFWRLWLKCIMSGKWVDRLFRHDVKERNSTSMG